MDKAGAGFTYLTRKFPRISDAKIKEGAFIGPQIRQLLEDDGFDQALSVMEKTAWEAFKLVATIFFWEIKEMTTTWTWSQTL